MLNFVGRCFQSCFPQSRSDSGVTYQSLKRQPKSFDNVPLPLNDKVLEKIPTFQAIESSTQENRIDFKNPHVFKINNKDVLFIPIRHIQLLSNKDKPNEIKKIQNTMTNFLRYKKCDALLLEGFPIVRSETSRGRFSLDEKLKELNGNQAYEYESDVAIHHLAENNKIGDIYSAEPDDTQVINYFLEKGVEKKYLVAYFIFRNLNSALNPQLDFDMFLDNELRRLNSFPGPEITMANLTLMAQSILNDTTFEFNRYSLNQKYSQRDGNNFQYLIQCAQPPKYPSIHDDAVNINDLANNISHFRDINLLSEINHATLTYGQDNNGKIVVMYGAHHFTTLFPALKFLSEGCYEELTDKDKRK